MASPFNISSWLLSPAPLTTGHPSGQPEASSSTQNNASTANTLRKDNSVADYSQYGLSDDAFASNITFQVPSFLAPAPGGALTSRPNYASAFGNQTQQQQQQQQQPSALASAQASNVQNNLIDQARAYNDQPKPSTAPYVPDPQRPVYSPYGSSVVAVNPDLTPFSKIADISGLRDMAASFQSHASGSSSKDDFNPHALGLPRVVGGNFPGLYSSSGFDLMGVLARVAARPYPQIDIGPVDTSCSFLVVDARKYDFPIVFASDNFTRLTGYSNAEVIGRNCRFLQAPDGLVSQGDKRKHTDGNGVFHMKTHILAGKEMQTSLVNYKKDGTPFINLVTIIPITWDTDEIAYFIGFQLDLVEQPNLIIGNMQAGTYTVNHTLQTGAPSVSDYANDPESLAQSLMKAQNYNPKSFEMPTDNEVEPGKAALHRALLATNDGLVLVMTLKGILLYVSPAAERFLEYESSELVNQNLSMLSNSSDVAAVTREFKDLTAAPTTTANLLCRMKRKRSGWVWLEFGGKLHMEHSKNRKAVILVGRPRPVYSLNWSLLTSAGGLGELECWSKVSSNGLFLYTTPSAHDILGFSASEMKGTSLYQLIAPQHAEAVGQALSQATAGSAVGLRHFLKNRRGQPVEVFTNFYPSGEPMSGSKYPFVLLQINEYSSELRRRRRDSAVPYLPKPANVEVKSPFSADGMSVDLPFNGSSSSSSNGGATSPYRDPESDNVFEELGTARNTSWQFELHQLKQTNRKLKEELDHVRSERRKRSRESSSANSVDCPNCGCQVDQAEQRSAVWQTSHLCQSCANNGLPRISPMSLGVTPSAASDTSID